MKIKGKYSWLKHLDFILIDLLALFISFFISFVIKFRNFSCFYNPDWVKLILIVLLMDILITLFTNPYSGILFRPYYMEIVRALQLGFFNCIAAVIFFYLFKIGESYSRDVVFWMYIIYFFLSLVMKYAWKKLLVSGKVVLGTTRKIPIFVIGSSKNIEDAIRNITAGDFQLYDVKGVYLVEDEEEDISKSTAALASAIQTHSVRPAETEPTNESIGKRQDPRQRKRRRTGAGNSPENKGSEVVIPVIQENFVEYVLDHEIQEVLITVSSTSIDHREYQRLVRHGVNLNLVIEARFGFQPEDQYISNFGVYKALGVGNFTFSPVQGFYLIVKRVLDILIGLIGTILLVPVSLVIKLCYLANGDTAKILYRQTRIGRNGKKFRLFKYRSMVPDADQVLQELLKDDKYRKDWEENQKLENDPRITKIGRVLRRTSVDELPQLINVLLGQMSLVGPRPLVAGELEKHEGLKLYQKVKPGITGWWGCNGRSNIEYRERLELEYYYVRNCSLYLDLLCIFRTFFAVLKKDGAQ